MMKKVISIKSCQIQLTKSLKRIIVLTNDYNLSVRFMKVFISWSGDRSKKIAESFSDWLPQIIQALEPWISSNIAKGSRSTPEISSELEKSKIGIICLTPENLDSNWLLFEAGALSKMNETKVCTFLLDLTPSDIKPPLSQFQHTIFNKEDVFRLIETINQQLSSSSEKQLAEKTLHQVFDRCWPDFKDTITKISRSQPEKTKQIRSDRDLLEEILEIVRGQEKQEISQKMGFDPSEMISNAGKRYERLTTEFGLSPNEAIRSVLQDMQKIYGLSPSHLHRIQDFLTEYNAMRGGKR